MVRKLKSKTVLTSFTDMWAYYLRFYAGLGAFHHPPRARSARTELVPTGIELSERVFNLSNLE